MNNCKCHVGPEWSGRPNPENPDNEWLCDECGRAVPASAAIGTAVEPRTVHCECGDYTGERCEWTGSPDDTVVVEYMPMYLRASHEAARNVGRYPHNGAVRIRCERSCAESIVEHDADWAWIVDE